MVILYILSEGTLRFSEIKKRLPNVTDANLTKDLRLLEAHGVIHREVYPVVPPKGGVLINRDGKSFYSYSRRNDQVGRNVYKSVEAFRDLNRSRSIYSLPDSHPYR